MKLQYVNLFSTGFDFYFFIFDVTSNTDFDLIDQVKVETMI
jgi:hypothetical protein